jgi:hypothetical protein
VSPRWRPEDVGEIHMAMAARPPSAGIGAFLDGSVTRSPRKALTDAEKADEAWLAREASLHVADFTMLRAHACEGLSCASDRHEADRDRYGGPQAGGEGMAALLEMLGLREPGTPYPVRERTRGRTGKRHVNPGPSP